LPHKNNICLLAKQSAYIHGASLRAGKTSLPGEIKGRLLKIFYTQKQKKHWSKGTHTTLPSQA
jgi:hypothetical protein